MALQNLPGKRKGTGWQKIMWLICLSRNAIVVILGMILAYSLSIHGVKPFELTGNITGGLPNFTLPPFSTNYNNTNYDFSDLMKIFGTSIVSVPLVAVLESIAIAKAFGKLFLLCMNVTKIQSSRIFIALINLFLNLICYLFEMS